MGPSSLGFWYRRSTLCLSSLVSGVMADTQARSLHCSRSPYTRDSPWLSLLALCGVWMQTHQTAGSHSLLLSNSTAPISLDLPAKKSSSILLAILGLVVLQPSIYNAAPLHRVHFLVHSAAVVTSLCHSLGQSVAARRGKGKGQVGNFKQSCSSQQQHSSAGRGGSL